MLDTSVPQSFLFDRWPIVFYLIWGFLCGDCQPLGLISRSFMESMVGEKGSFSEGYGLEYSPSLLYNLLSVIT